MGILQWRGRTSKKAFRERMKEALLRDEPGLKIRELGELELQIEGLSDGRTLKCWLGRAYEEFLKSPEDAEEIIARWSKSIAAPLTEGIDLDEVVPIIKDQRWLNAQGDAGGSGFDPLLEPYNAELVVVYAEFRKGLRFHDRSDFTAAGVTLPDFRDRALVNLRRRTANRKIVGGDGTYLIGAGGNFDASVILLDDFADDRQLEIEGELLVGVPDRDTLAVGGDADPFHVWKLAAAVAGWYRSESYAISPQLFRRSGGRFELLDPSAEDLSHPIPRLDVVDVLATKKGGGSRLEVVVASPLATDARSIFRLFTKVEGQLTHINSAEFRSECGEPTPENSSIAIHLHRDSDPAIFELLKGFCARVHERNATLHVETFIP